MKATLNDKVRATLSAVLIRADGTRQDLGVIASTVDGRIKPITEVASRAKVINVKPGER